MTSWIERDDLRKLVERDVAISGRETLGSILDRERELLVPLTDPACPPVDIGTYRTRLSRWKDGEGPALTGIENFVEVLESLSTPARAATISGIATTYVLILDVRGDRILAAVATDTSSDGEGGRAGT
ncbi:MAG: hypothetical protein ACRDJ1_02125 [Actinomycetota bacterium]